MGLREWIISKLKDDVEPDNGYVELDKLDEETRNDLFVKFGEGSPELTNFLKIAYKHNAPSIYCCSGHGVESPYVRLRVNDENIELLRKIGKILSKQGISTNFTDDHIKGLYVDYRSMNSNPSTEWLNLASQIMENPELFKSDNPEIYYHEQIQSSYKPFLFDIKKKLLNYLRNDTQKKFPLRFR